MGTALKWLKIESTDWRLWTFSDESCGSLKQRTYWPSKQFKTLDNGGLTHKVAKFETYNRTVVLYLYRDALSRLWFCYF